MQLQNLRNFYKKKRNIVWVILILGLLIVTTYIYNYSAQAYAYRYVFAYNNNNFEKVFSYYDQETIQNKFTKEEIMEFLSEQAKVDGKINIKELTMIKDKKTKKWLVKFPYELQNIHVFAPTGATVYVDNKKIVQGNIGKEIEIKDMLPGRHQVVIEYYGDMYPPFTQEIYIPRETRVDSPYATYNIMVFAPSKTWVTMGNVVKYNSDASVLFENMLPGQYVVSLFMDDKEIELFSQTIQVDEQYTNIHIEKVKGNKKVKEDLSEFFKTFNIEYEKGIINRDTNFLHKFSTNKINENIISDFKMWYIDNKDITDAKSLMEIRDIYDLSGKELKASVLETVYLTNREKDEGGKNTTQEYRVVIEWNYKLLRNNSKWEIIEREILQSIVAYKDEEGRWIRY